MTGSVRRYAAGAAVSLVGVLTLLVPLYDIWDDVTDLSWGVATTFVENSPLIALSLGLIAAGVWLVRQEWSDDDLIRVAFWNVGGAAAVFLLYAWVMALQFWAMGELKPVVLALDGVLFGAVAAFAVGVYHTRQRRTMTVLRDRERNLRELHDVISDDTAAFDDKLDRLLDIGRDLFDAEFASFAHVDPETNEYRLEAVKSDDIDLAEGDVVPYSQTHCQEMIQEDETVQFAVRPYDAGEKPYGTDEGFEMYVGTPVYVGDAVYGSLCFLDREQSDAFADWELTMVELMGNWIGYELDRERYIEAQREHLQEREQRFESVVDAVDEYAIFMLDDEGRVKSWNEGAQNIKGYEPSDIIGEHIRTFYREEDAQAGKPERLLSQAAEEGQVHDEGWRVRKDGTQFWGDVTISARYDDGELQGYTKVTRDMTDERSYERALEHERERLEFMNRILRHNLLNGLNLVNARAQHLETTADLDADDREHLDIVRERVQDMSDLIDTMRTFMDAIVSDSDHDLQKMALRERLTGKVELARGTYDEATFDVHDLPDEDVLVYGDELLGEVFENILSNAVVHNDAATPHVEVWTTTGTTTIPVDADTGDPLSESADPMRRDVEHREHDAVTVHIADNGPGIPDEEKRAVLEKGVSELSEPGNGFGLYLVKEMLDAYGGSVDIRDNDPEGTVFAVTFLRAD
ncbi:PAS domain S-box protein [Salarchaeum japonicum]|uniref:histidine kinase n=1 Tax=Salarchaeum japonicum TaxID=555573 RepID=A0AAV3T2K4_9EURY|nr:PAS domain S-box protein [Salarchaeum japonicum]